MAVKKTRGRRRVILRVQPLMTNLNAFFARLADLDQEDQTYLGQIMSGAVAMKSSWIEVQGMLRHLAGCF